MALEKFEYPATGSATNSFLPSRNPSFDGAHEQTDEGILQDQSSGAQEYRYEEGVNIRTITRSYRNMADSEKTSYEAFRAAVGGDVFKFTDYGGAAHTVSFASFVRAFTPQRGNRWDFTIEMREQL